MLALVLAYKPYLVPSFAVTSSAGPESVAPSIGLVAGGLVVTSYILLTRSTKGAIALPADDEKSFIVEVDEEVDPGSFYPKLRRRKLALIGLVTGAFAVGLFQGGWDIANQVGTIGLVQDGLMLVFWVSRVSLTLSGRGGG